MFSRFTGISIPRASSASLTAFWLILFNLAFNILANASFRVSALSEMWRGILAQINLEGSDGGRALLEHLGFTILPYHRPAGAFGEFWENFYTWWLIWTYNPISLRHRHLFALQRNEFWMRKERFLVRFENITRK